MVRDVCHWRELNSQGKKGVLLAIFLLSIATVLTKSIIKTQNSLLWLGGDNSFKSHFCGNSFQKAVVLNICCWKSSTVSDAKKSPLQIWARAAFSNSLQTVPRQAFWELSIIICHSTDINLAGFGYFPKAEWCKNINNLFYWPFTS